MREFEETDNEEVRFVLRRLLIAGLPESLALAYRYMVATPGCTAYEFGMAVGLSRNAAGMAFGKLREFKLAHSEQDDEYEWRWYAKNEFGELIVEEGVYA